MTVAGVTVASDDRTWIVVDNIIVAAGVRRAAVTLAEEIGLPAAKVADVAIVATEMATNAARHADDGAMLLRVRRLDGNVGIELIATDRGPGMADVEHSARDGQSTGGTLGIGMGAIARLADELDIYSRPPTGTTVAATVWHSRPGTTAWVAGISRPIDGEHVCGDGYVARVIDGRRQIMVCDGLGHGPIASIAARAVEAAFESAPDLGPRDVLQHIHAATGHTRGAVAAIAEFDVERGILRYAGIGNIAGIISGETGRRAMVSLPGIVGQRKPQFREFDYPLPAASTVVMHSDGLTARWTFDDYPGLTTHTPAVVAAVLLRTLSRGRDDATALVARPGAS
jgi:anti-sigma regulatory factor (Ser/Thr protein kinase)